MITLEAIEVIFLYNIFFSFFSNIKRKRRNNCACWGFFLQTNFDCELYFWRDLCPTSVECWHSELKFRKKTFTLKYFQQNDLRLKITNLVSLGQSTYIRLRAKGLYGFRLRSCSKLNRGILIELINTLVALIMANFKLKFKYRKGSEFENKWKFFLNFFSIFFLKNQRFWIEHYLIDVKGQWEHSGRVALVLPLKWASSCFCCTNLILLS